MEYSKKGFLALIAILLSVYTFSSSTKYEVGDVLLCKKKTSSVTLFKYEKDLMKQIRSPYDETGGTAYKPYHPNNVYQVLKGDKIILLESKKEGSIYRVALVKKKKRGGMQSPYYFVNSKSFKNLAFSEHLTE